ncbi:MAG TPA: response regulator [Blastocatellia bacterium]|nr:response regulator [Blastocatellia bacterium]
MKVMVVEDEAASRKLLCVVLTADGHSVVAAANARAALETVKADNPDVVLLDLGLPEMDGLELARLLKSDQVTAHIPLVAITAFPDRFCRENALKAGCDTFIVKPVNTRTLAKELSDVVAEQPAPGSDASPD